MPRTIARARAVGPYDDHLRDISHAFKYGQRRTLAPPLSALMARHGRAVLEGADVSVAVPLHWRRRRERGFNQAALLAAGLGLPVWHALRRRRRTRSQVELPAGERHRNVEQAFVLTWRVRLLHIGVGRGCGWWRVPEVVVLVDDVSTTGATLEACARVLKQAGVKEVRAL
ncbi:MAG: phosphoribosyltransferase family protein, partial [Acidobacteria bacterium]|nr:phosphoribosyltransferase family protein [Acidobacteriota bacterium]